MSHDIVRMKNRRENYYEEIRRQSLILETRNLSTKERQARLALLECIEEEVAALERAIEDILDRSPRSKL